jgi:hypothetical protein
VQSSSFKYNSRLITKIKNHSTTVIFACKANTKEFE